MIKHFFLVMSILLTISGCKKCVTCGNECKQCTDNRFTIKVCSDKLTFKYYNEYVDSLTDPALGWVCTAIESDSTYELCSTSKHKKAIEENEGRGFVCK
jgi:hypothetical protein